MLLAVDIGNSTIGLALFPDPSRERFSVRKIPAAPAQSKEFYKSAISAFVLRHVRRGRPHSPVGGIINGVISSVVPSLSEVIVASMREAFGITPLLVSHKVETGLTFTVKSPEQVGADRIANAVAAAHHGKGAVAIADFGTATTITVVDRQRRFLGGAILPGLELMQKSLHQGTAQLPAISFKDVHSPLGTDTASSITSGILWGTAGAVEALLKGMEKEVRFRLHLLVTGGYSALMSSLLKRTHHTMPGLTFEGLRLIHLKNIRTIQKDGK